MTRFRFPLLMSAAIAAAATTMSAGGWAVVTLNELPDRFEAGRAVPLTFMVRQHGVSPMTGLSPSIEASYKDVKVSAAATATAKTGEYRANLTLPTSGEWTITVHTGFLGSKLTLLPVSVVTAGAPAVETASRGSLTEHGRRLFVAKGCVTCHAQAQEMSTPALNIGPAIVAQKYRDEFLARVLENPSAALPRRTPNAEMPNLNLQPREIAALVAYINHVPTTSSR